MTDMEKLIIEHGGDTVPDTFFAYKYFKHENYLEYKDGELVAFVSYFSLKEFDVIISIAKNNKYTLSQWRVLKRLIEKRDKQIRIVSDPTNLLLLRLIDKYEGEWKGKVVIFN